MTTFSPTPKPRPRAPRGNKNRYLHGRYARQPKPAPPAASAPASAADSPSARLTLADDIAYLRAYMQNTALLGTLPRGLGSSRETLHTLSLGANALARLVHTENWLSQTPEAQAQLDELPSVLEHMERFQEFVGRTLRPRPEPTVYPASPAVKAELERCLDELDQASPSGQAVEDCDQDDAPHPHDDQDSG